MPEKTEWVTVKVPREDREQAAEYKPEGLTWGACLVAGAERVNENLDSDTRLSAGTDIDTEALADAIRAELDTDAPVFDEVQRAVRTIEERTGRIEQTLEDMGARR